MAEIIADRVLEISSSTGTGDFVVGGAATGYRPFGAVASAGDTFYGSIVAVDGNDKPTGEWEVGYYKLKSPTAIERTTVTASSNGNQKVNFGAGRKHVFISLSAYQAERFQKTTSTPPAGGTTTPPPGGGTTTPPDTGTTPTATYPHGRAAGIYSTLQWAEEFNGTSLDGTKWVTRNAYEDVEPPIVNYKVEGGSLHIWPQTNSSGAFFSRTIESRGLVTRGYSYIEIEAAMPKGRGLRPILGLHNTEGGVPRFIEIAVVKPGETNYNTGGTPDNFDAYLFNQTTEAGARTLKSVVANADLTQFNKYAVHWDSTGVEWFFNGTSLGKFTTTAFNTRQMYVTLALEMNTGGIAPGSPSDQNLTPQGATNAMRVNYVRAWNIVAENGQSTGGGTTTPPPTTVNGTIDWYGNSTVFGWDPALNGGANEGDPVATTMPEAFHATAPTTSGVNRGVNAARARDALNGTGGVPWANWATHIASTSATYVILQYREYDTLSNLTTYLTQVVNQAKAAGKTVIIQTDIPSLNNLSGSGGLTHQQIAQGQRDVASATGVHLMDLHKYIMEYCAANGIADPLDTTGDTQHPTQAYYLAWGQWCKARFAEIVGATTTNPTPGNQTGYVAPVGQSSSDYPTMIFRDEFSNGTAPNGSKWPLQKMWYEGSQYANRGNIDINGGNLRMWATPWSSSSDPGTRYPNEGGFYKNHNATLCTDGVFDFRYGFIEFRARVPYGKGPFPALWLYGHKDMNGNEISRRPEIDIMECYPSGTENSGWSTSDNLHPNNYVSTVWETEGVRVGYRKGNDVGIAYGTDLSAEFHVYGCRWDASGVQFYYDGQPFGTKISTTVMNLPMYLVIDYWMGGESGFPNDPPGSLVENSTNSLLVDYVRVWALNDNSTTVISLLSEAERLA